MWDTSRAIAARFGRKALSLLLAGILLIAVAGRPAAQAERYDLLLRNARIADGTGSPWYRGDVAVRGDTIVRIARSLTGPAARAIDVGGQILAPGFIDIHNHASGYIYSARGIFDQPTAPNYVRQGVTTLIEGPDGRSPVPLAPFFARLEALQTSVNIGSFIGQGAVRAAVMGEADRPASPQELERMRGLVAQGMRDGALGLSSGLFHVPGAYTSTEEVIELARIAGRLGGIHVSHIRDEASHVVDSVQETIAIGERGGLPTQVTHHKIVGPGNWGRSRETLQLIHEARARGVDVTIDLYPYTGSSTNVSSALLPAWSRAGGREALLARLRDPAERARIQAETARMIRDERGGGDPENVVLAACAWDESLAGQSLADISRLRGEEPSIAGAAEATLWIVEQGDCAGVFHAMHEQDLERILRDPATMVASDGGIPVFGEGSPHPRTYGTFARVLAVYVRERSVITLEDAVRRMSAFPAQRLGLADRGLVRPGMKADLVVFDPARVRDAATFERPHQYAEGFSHVIVNGQVVFEDGAITPARPGRVLYGPARRTP